MITLARSCMLPVQRYSWVLSSLPHLVIAGHPVFSAASSSVLLILCPCPSSHYASITPSTTSQRHRNRLGNHVEEPHLMNREKWYWKRVVVICTS
ncbi:hypothetical protein BC827DRAFT_174392 [Russula dissimulans]|nr:hypothetical protein BC827DRAFT_174392 [Russula dissimulans]